MRLINAEKLWLTTEYVDGKEHKYYEQFEVDDAPTIDAEPVRHGKWTRNYESSWGDSRFMCSVCHCKESVPTCNGEPTVWDYCPNCGAKMDSNDSNDSNALNALNALEMNEVNDEVN